MIFSSRVVGLAKQQKYDDVRLDTHAYLVPDLIWRITELKKLKLYFRPLFNSTLRHYFYYFCVILSVFSRQFLVLEFDEQPHNRKVPEISSFDHKARP